MPKMKGTELRRKIHDSRPELPIVMCTGYSDGLDTEQLRAMGFEDILIKPLTKRQLAEAVRQALSRAT